MPGPRNSGRLISALLAGSWRAEPPPCPLSVAEIVQVAPLLIHSCAASVAWRKIAPSSLANHPDVQNLHQAARREIANALAGEVAVFAVAAILNGGGITPLVFKGWSVSRRYANPYDRSYRDIDLMVRPEEFATARDILTRRAIPGRGEPAAGIFELAEGPGHKACSIDLHAGFSSYYNTSAGDVLQRSTPVTGRGGGRILVPADEDHLRLVILHFFKHGGWRPLWLCDVAAMVEAAGPGFDWDRCLGLNAPSRRWIETGIATAATLLGGTTTAAPASAQQPPPAWLIATVLAEWRAPFASRFRPPKPKASIGFAIGKVASYWPNPIAAALITGGLPRSLRPVQSQVRYFVEMTVAAAMRRTRKLWMHDGGQET